MYSFFHGLQPYDFSSHALLHNFNHKLGIYRVSFFHELHPYDFSIDPLLQNCHYKSSIYGVSFLDELHFNLSFLLGAVSTFEMIFPLCTDTTWPFTLSFTEHL